MKADFRQRWAVPVCIGIVVLLVGGGSAAYALFLTPSAETTYPTKPSTLTNESVAKYVTEYEEAYLMDEIDEPGAETSVFCDATMDVRTERGFYGLVTCEASVDRGNSVLDLPHMVTAYFVNDTATERIGRFGSSGYRRLGRDIVPDSPADGNASTRNGSASLRAYNFASETANVTIRIASIDSSAVPSTTTNYSVPPAGGVVETDDAVRRGTYRVEVEPERGETKTRNWTVGEPPSQELLVYVTPNGSVAVATVGR
ncbi:MULTISPECIES: hypothetical protein [Halorussus]|uniref:hypothetical protein n=1 Tax=Halorussus TaxID=1070314 RepID=UPI00209E2338|nr:hypothetical protein [Halorussus vallis]USZ74338.1 hypothetical protein NGM07_12890 [Halorussus vallis]